MTVDWRGPARPLPAGPWQRGQEWMTRAACTAPDVDPAWFTVEESAPGAALQIAKAKTVCRACPVKLLCRIHADETGEYGVYAAETYTERTRRLARWRRLQHDLDLEASA